MLSDAGFCAEGAKVSLWLNHQYLHNDFQCSKPCWQLFQTACNSWRYRIRRKVVKRWHKEKNRVGKNNKHYINSKSIIQFKEHIQIREAYKKDQYKSTWKLHSKIFFSADKSHALLLVLNFTCGEKNNEIHPKIPFFQAWKISQVSQLGQKKKIK